MVLSLPPEEQARANGPGCLTCDLLNDFDLARSAAIEDAAANLSINQKQLLDRIDALMVTMQGPDVACFDEEVVQRPVWGELRALAIETLRAFGWEGSTVQPYVEVAPGVWRRPPVDGVLTAALVAADVRGTRIR